MILNTAYELEMHGTTIERTQRGTMIDMEDAESSIMSTRPYRAPGLDKLQEKILALSFPYIKTHVQWLFKTCL